MNFNRKNILMTILTALVIGQTIEASNIIYIQSKSEFEQKVLNNSRPAVLKFSATWCPPCKRIKGLIEEIAELHTEVNFVDINFDNFPELSNKYNIRTLPTLIFLAGPANRKKEITNRHVGSNVSKKELTEKIKRAFNLKK